MRNATGLTERGEVLRESRREDGLQVTAPTPPELTCPDMLVILAVLAALIATMLGLAFGLLWLGEWFWMSVVCEDWVVCQ